jgi:hypothetical protein
VIELANPLKLLTKPSWLLKSRARKTVPRPSTVKIQRPFMIRVVQRQPPASRAAENRITALPIPNCHHSLVARSSPALTSELLSLTSPTALSDGPSATVTNACAVKARTRITPETQKNEEMTPSRGWVTLPTST